MASPGTVSIHVNGREKHVPAGQISYEDLVKLAYGDNPPTDPDVILTVNYKVRGTEGSLLAGESVEVVPGMMFDVFPTKRS